MNELRTHPGEYPNRSFPHFGRPKLIGYLSLDADRNYKCDTSQLKFLNKVPSGEILFDLNKNVSKVIRRANENKDEKITHLLQFLLDQEPRLKLNNGGQIALEKAKFYCYRGLLTCIACTPYENREPWRIVVTLYKGSIFLCARDTKEQWEKKRNMSEKDLKFCSWGFKFEQYLLSDDPRSAPNTETPVNENEEFSLVFFNRLNKHEIVYAGEMDGVAAFDGQISAPPSDASKPADIITYFQDKKFIELKTNRHMESPNQVNSFRRFKVRKWWCQSFIAGVDTIICGFRDDEGIVDELKTYDVRELPKMCANKWNPNVCFNFCDSFFTYVKRCLAREISRKYGDRHLKDLSKLDMVTLHLEWSPRTNVTVTDNYDPDLDKILPDWFLRDYGR